MSLLKISNGSKKIFELKSEFGRKRSECYCNYCGLQFSMVKEWVLKSQSPTPWNLQKVIIQFWQRGLCGSCNRTSMAKAEWIHPKFESMTCGYAEIAGRLMEEMTCEAVGRILFSPSKMMWQLDQYRMETMLQFYNFQRILMSLI